MTSNTTSTPKRILTISGSLRKDSFNTKLATIATDYLSQQGVSAEFVDIANLTLPLFNEDNEHQPNENLTILRRLFSEADGLLIASPEYNGSFSAALKNTIDWLSRPSQDGYQSPFSQLSVALVAASPGSLGGLRGLSQLRELMGNLGSLIVPSQLAVGQAHEVLSDKEISNPVTKERFEAILDRLIELS